MGAIPIVTISYAQSLDGRIATAAGDSRWISSPRTLTLAHRLRRKSAAILVGIGTVLRDDPRLTCRLPGSPSPVRVVLDSRLRLPPQSRIALSAAAVRTLVFTSAEALAGEDGPARRREVLERAGIRVLPVAGGGPGGIALRPALERLAQEGLGTLMVEGGGRVITSFLRARLVHRMVVVVAPLLIGRGVEAVGDLEIGSLQQALRPRRFRTRRMGDDLVWELDFDGP